MKRFLLSSLILLSFLTVYAQDALQPAWNSFLNNKHDDAKKLFTAALTTPQKSEALLGLALLSENNKLYGESFKYFSEFYKNEKEFSPYLFALWTSTTIHQGSVKKNEEALAFFNEIAKRTDIDGALIAAANSTIGNHYKNKLKVDEAKKFYDKIGAIDKWQICGEFENISASGFDKSYDVLLKPASDAVFINKYGSEVKWITPKFNRSDKWFDFTYYFESIGSVVFAQTFITSSSEMEVELRIGVSGSVKTWLNDQLIISESEERNNDLDTYIQKVKLQKGVNRVLVQIGESYAGRSNFLLRITDDKGVPVKGLTYSSKFQPYEKPSSLSTSTVNIFAEDYFQNKVEQFPDNPLNHILLAKTYLRSDKVFESRHVLEQLIQKYPKSTYLNIMMIELFAKSDDRTGIESAREVIKMNDPEYPISLYMNFNNAIDKQNYIEAQKYFDKLESVVGADDETLLEKKILLLAKQKKPSEMIKTIHYAYSKFPENRTIVSYEYYIKKDSKNAGRNTSAIIKKYVANNEDLDMPLELAQIHFNVGEISAGIKVYLDAIHREPVSVGLYSKLGSIYYQIQNYQLAEEYLLKAIEIAPYISSFHASLAKIYDQQNKSEKAIASYKTTLNLKPNDYTSIRELRRLEKKKNIDEYFPKPDVMELAKTPILASSYPNDNSVIINESVNTVIYSNGGSEETHFILVKILNQKGLERWKQYSANVSNWQNYIIDKAEVIKVNGRVVPSEVSENQFVFTNLEVGDCINVEYRLFNYSSGKLAGKFWGNFYFSHGVPYLNSSYNLLVAKGQPISYKFSVSEIKPEITALDEFDLYSWKKENEPAIEYEDKMPVMSDVANILYMTTFPDWSFVSNWYNDLASAKAKPSFEVKEVVGTLMSDKKNLNDLQKAELIYNYITTNITYSSVSFRQSGLIPQNPSVVLNTRIGDCKDLSVLYVSMAKVAGINAQLVLVNTRDNGLKGLVLPSIDFNHCIVKLLIDEKEYYLELTSNYLPFASLTRNSINSLILDIEGKSSGNSLKYLNPQTRKLNNIRRMKTVSIDNNDLVVIDKNVRVAAATSYSREAYKDLAQKELIKKVQESVRTVFPTAEVSSAEFKNLETHVSTDTLHSLINFRIKDDIKKLGGMTVVNLPWSSKALNNDFEIIEPRKYGIDIAEIYAIDENVQIINFQIPPGKSIIENIKPLKLSNEFMDFNLTVKQNGNTVVYTRTLTLKNDIVPEKDVLAFRDFYKKIIEIDNQQIVLK